MWQQLAYESDTDFSVTVMGPFEEGLAIAVTGELDGGIIQFWGWIGGSPVVTPTSQWKDMNSNGWVAGNINDQAYTAVGIYYFPPMDIDRIEIVATVVGSGAGTPDYSAYLYPPRPGAKYRGAAD